MDRWAVNWRRWFKIQRCLIFHGSHLEVTAMLTPGPDLNMHCKKCGNAWFEEQEQIPC